MKKNVIYIDATVNPMQVRGYLDFTVPVNKVESSEKIQKEPSLLIVPESQSSPDEQ